MTEVAEFTGEEEFFGSGPGLACGADFDDAFCWAETWPE